MAEIERKVISVAGIEQVGHISGGNREVGHISGRIRK